MLVYTQTHMLSLTHSSPSHTHTQERKTHTSAEQTPISFLCVLNNNVWSEWIDQFLGTLFKHPEQADRCELKHLRLHSNACLLELTYTHIRYTLHTARGHQLFFFLFVFRFPEIQTSVSLSRSDMHDLRQLSLQFEEKVWLIPPLSTSRERNILL